MTENASERYDSGIAVIGLVQNGWKKSRIYLQKVYPIQLRSPFSESYYFFNNFSSGNFCSKSHFLKDIKITKSEVKVYLKFTYKLSRIDLLLTKFSNYSNLKKNCECTNSLLT